MKYTYEMPEMIFTILFYRR